MKFNFVITAPGFICTCLNADTVCEKLQGKISAPLTEKDKAAVRSFCENVRNENETLNIGEATVASVIRGKRNSNL